jgi:hypothetical protein
MPGTPTSAEGRALPAGLAEAGPAPATASVVGADPAGQPFSVTVPFGLSRAVRAVTCRPDVAERWAVTLDWFGPGFSRTVVRGCRAAVALLT